MVIEYHINRSIGSKLFAIGVCCFEDSIGNDGYDVARLQPNRIADRNDKIIDNAERHRIRVENVDGMSNGAVLKDWCLARAEADECVVACVDFP